MAEKRLYRSKNKVFCGVVGGLAEYYGKDPVFLRVIAIVLLVMTGFFPLVLIYAIAYLLMPEQIDGEI